MKRILALTMMLVLGFSGLGSVAFAEEEQGDPKHTEKAPGEDPADNMNKTFTGSGAQRVVNKTHADVSAVGTGCAECAARLSNAKINANTVPGSSGPRDEKYDKNNPGAR